MLGAETRQQERPIEMNQFLQNLELLLIIKNDCRLPMIRGKDFKLSLLRTSLGRL